MIVGTFKMRIEKLIPKVQGWEPFARSKAKFVPASPGCYVLSTFEGDVLYVGLAKDLRRRFNEHLENPEKKNPTEEGRATKFHWFETQDMQRVERTWINIHVDAEGRMPLLNKVYSPT